MPEPKAQCPNCGAAQSAALLGMQTRCAECGEVFVLGEGNRTEAKPEILVSHGESVSTRPRYPALVAVAKWLEFYGWLAVLFGFLLAADRAVMADDAGSLSSFLDAALRFGCSFGTALFAWGNSEFLKLCMDCELHLSRLADRQSHSAVVDEEDK